IAGNVSAADAPALAGVTVQLLANGFSPQRQTTTDAAGHYQFLNVDQGYYTVHTINTLGYTDQYSPGAILSTSPATIVNFTLAPNTPIGYAPVQPPMADGTVPLYLTFNNV